MDCLSVCCVEAGLKPRSTEKSDACEPPSKGSMNEEADALWLIPTGLSLSLQKQGRRDRCRKVVGHCHPGTARVVGNKSLTSRRTKVHALSHEMPPWHLTESPDNPSTRLAIRECRQCGSAQKRSSSCPRYCTAESLLSIAAKATPSCLAGHDLDAD